MSTTELQAEACERLKEEWLVRLQTLIDQVKRWAVDAGWKIHEDVKPVIEPALGKYQVPLLLLQRGEREFVLSPLPRPGLAPEGVVDVYLMPGYDDVVSLEFQGGQWFVSCTSGGLPTASRWDATAGRPFNRGSLLGFL